MHLNIESLSLLVTAVLVSTCIAMNLRPSHSKIAQHRELLFAVGYSGDWSVLVSAELPLTLFPDRSIFQSCLQQSTLRSASILFPHNTRVCSLRQIPRRSIATERKRQCFNVRWFKITICLLPMSFPDKSMYLASSREEGVYSLSS